MTLRYRSKATVTQCTQAQGCAGNTYLCDTHDTPCPAAASPSSHEVCAASSSGPCCPARNSFEAAQLLQMRRFKYREARHRRTVESTDRRVRRYAVIKLAIVAVIAMCQPLILSQFFKERL